VLPLLAASVITDEQVVILDCPKITDVQNMISILNEIGCVTHFEGDNLIIDSSSATNHEIPPKMAKELRSSIFMLGSILTRFSKAKIAYPGGCDIGLRPIDLHIKGLKMLGVKIKEGNGIIDCSCNKMIGNEIVLDFPSVGATENILLASVKAQGYTTIKNAAKEPEIVDLQNFINSMGGKIRGAGSSTIVIEGVEKLHSTVYKPISDRIETGTYLIAAAMTKGEIELENANSENIASLLYKLNENGCKIHTFNDKITLIGAAEPVSAKLIETAPYPSFPTDLQAPIMAYCCICSGSTLIVENLFETRFKHVSELIKMGADIVVRGRTALIRSVKNLTGAEIYAYDLRGGAALTIAALAAEGESILNGVSFIDRGYYNFGETLNSLG
jgi:UDP-N-acetylglucosamine 1-carboxyvinyltransferase